MFKSVFVRRILVLLLSVAVIGIYSFGSTASLFAESGSGIAISGVTFNKDEASRTSYSVTADWIIVKQASSEVMLWTREEVNDAGKQAILDKAQSKGGDGSLKGVTLSNVVYHYGAGKWSLGGSTNMGDYEFIINGTGVTLNVYDHAGTLNAGKISHIDYGTYTKTAQKGSISVTKSLVNGSGVNGTFYFKLLNSAGTQIGTLRSLTVTNGKVSGTASWSCVEYGQYTVIETNARGTALTAGTTVLGKKLVAISNDNSTPVTLNSATATAVVTNTYEGSKAKLSFGVEKQMQGRTFKTGDAFTFALFQGASATGTPLDTVTTDATSGSSQKLTFNEIEFGQVGTYNYTVVEQVPSETNGVEYSSEVYKIKVVVTINGSGNYVATPTITNSKGTETSMVFVNKYDAKGSATINVNKTLNGRDMVEGEFSFKMVQVDSEGKAIEGKAWTATNAEDGTVDFGSIDYTLADAGKTYTYKVSEVVPEGGVKDNVKYDTTVHTVTVKVGTDQGDGTLSDSTVTYESGSSVEFTNVYGASGSIDLSATKTLENKTLVAGAYEFKIVQLDAEGKEIASTAKTVHNDANGKVALGTLNYNLADLDGAASKNFTYKVTEVDNNAGGITYDHSVYYAVVKVTNNGSDKLETSVKYFKGDETANAISFKNVYQASGSVTISVNKTLVGKDITAGAYTFRLVQVDSNNNEIAGTEKTATNDANGTVTFGQINYGVKDAGKTYTYKITEVIPEGVVNGIGNNTVYDTSTHYVTVEVGADNGDGTLAESKVNYPVGGISFTNTYGAKGSINLVASKNLYNKDLTDKAFAFSAFLEGSSDASAVGFNTADGNVAFTAINYTLSDLDGAQSKDFTYIISEDKGTAAGITYDQNQYKAVVTVTNDGSNELKTSVQYFLDGNLVEGVPEFNNKYEASPVEVTLKADKMLEGRDLAAGEFTFNAVAVPMPKAAAVIPGETENLKLTAKNAADGTVTFDSLTFSHAGQYKFIISEENGGQTINNVSYDSVRYMAVIDITDNKDAGKLEAKVTYTKMTDNVTDANVVEVPAFTNTYTAPKTVGITVNKVWDDNANAAGLRPAKITVHLMNGTTVVDTKELTADTNWTYTWTDLPKYNGDQLISYTVTEDVVAGYQTTISGGMNLEGTAGTYVITNTSENLTPPPTNDEGSGGTTVTPVNNNTSAGGTTATAENNYAGPKTGDTSDLAMQLLILSMAVSGLGGALYVRRRSQSEER